MRLLGSVRRVTARVLLVLGCTVPLAACDFVTGVPSVSRVEVSLTPLTIAPGEAAALTGVAYDRNGNPIRNNRRTVNFTSSNPEVATVNNATGQVLGVSLGTTEITGETDGKRSTVLLTVQLPTVRQVIIGTRDPIVRRGVASALGVTVLDTLNRAMANRPVNWRSLDETIVQVSGAGVLTPRAVGTARVIAAIPDTGTRARADTVTVRVTEVPIQSVRLSPQTGFLYVGDELALTATLQDSLGNAVTDRPIAWSVSPQLAGLVSANGVLRALAPALPLEVRAQVDRVPGFPVVTEGVTRVDVLSRVDTILLSTPSLTLRSDATVSVQLQYRDPNGSVIQDLTGRRELRVTSNNPTVAEGERTGVVRAKAVAVRSTAVLTYQVFDVASDQPQGKATRLTVTVDP
jgi:uncharacterized protein YjdB